jgi:hypothetical protein
VICLLSKDSLGQVVGLDMLGEKTVVTIPFKYINGHIIISVKMHNMFDVNYIFDTGAQNTVLFESKYVELFGFTPDRQISLVGADLSTPIYADVVRRVKMEIEGTYQVVRDIIVLRENFLKIEEAIGVNVVGIVGSDYFRNLLVHIDYYNEKILLYNPKNAEAKLIRGFTLIPADFNNGKVYINSIVALSHPDTINILRLLLDTGASLSSLINISSDSSLVLPIKILPSILGQGLSGPLLGYVSKIKRVQVSEFSLSNMIAYFQDDGLLILDQDKFSRNGILGNQFLSRFEIIIDYFNQKLYLKKSKNYSRKISYDLSGITLMATGAKLDKYKIRAIINTSSSFEAGLRADDEILKIGCWSTWRYTLEDLSNKLSSKPGKKIKLTIKRNDAIMKFEFVLKDLLE